MTDDDGGACVVCGVPLDDEEEGWVELTGPERGDALHACSQQHAAEAVASWVQPTGGDGVPESQLGDTVATVVLLAVLLAVLGLLGLGGYQLLQLVGLV